MTIAYKITETNEFGNNYFMKGFGPGSEIEVTISKDKLGYNRPIIGEFLYEDYDYTNPGGIKRYFRNQELISR